VGVANFFIGVMGVSILFLRVRVGVANLFLSGRFVDVKVGVR